MITKELIIEEIKEYQKFLNDQYSLLNIVTRNLSLQEQELIFILIGNIITELDTIRASVEALEE